MPTPPFVISLPTADRVRARDFYRDALGLESPGPIADDGVPEPLHFALGDGVVLMLIPTGGFGSTSGAGSANAISFAAAGFVKSITLMPDW